MGNLKDCNELTSNNEETTEIDETDLRQLNFHHENVSWDEIKEIIKEMPWTELFDGKNNEECTNIFIYFIKVICLWLIPKKRNKNKNHIPKERKKLLNRIKMLKRKEHRDQEKYTMEKKVIDNMKENPKVLFDYIRRQKDRDTKIGPFKRGKDYIYDSREICKMLID